MGVIRLESFDAWNRADNSQRWEDAGGADANLTFEVAAAKTGTQGMHFDNANSTLGTFTIAAYGNKIWDDGTNEASPNEVGIGFWVKYSSGISGDTDLPLLTIGTSKSPTKFFYLTVLSAGSLKLWENKVTNSFTAGSTTEVDTFTEDIDANTLSLNDANWHHIEMFFGHAADNDDDIYEIRVNGVRVTIAGEATALTPISDTGSMHMRLSRQEQGIYVDSVYTFEFSSTASERFLGPVDIAAILPNEAGANAGWNGDTDEPNSYRDIDDALAEAKDDTEKVIVDTTSQVRHDWAFENVSTDYLNWKVLQACPMFRTGSGDSGNVKCYAISGGKITPSAYFTIPSSSSLDPDDHVYPLSSFTTYSWLRFIGTPEDHNLDSTVAALNAMTFGVENVEGDDTTLRLTHFPIEVAVPSAPIARMTQSVVEYAVLNPTIPIALEARMSQLAVEYAMRTPLPEPNPDNQAHRALFVECMAHSNTDDGFGGGGADYWRCVAEGNGGRGFVDPHNMVHCVAHGNTSHGIEITHGQPATLMYCCSVLNQGAGLQLTEVASSKVPFVLLIKYSAHSNTDGRIAQSGATPATSTYIDEDAVTLSGDPFTNAAAQDFSLNATYGDPLKNLLGDAFYKFPRTVSYHDHQAIQRICPTVDDDELNQFTDTMSNRSIN